MPFDRGVSLTYVGRGRYFTNAPVTYRGRRDVFTIPAHFQTDLASSPWWIWSLIPPTGLYEEMAVLHDWLCTDGIRGGFVTSAEADGIFRRGMREAGVPLPLRWCMWTAVRWAALANPLRRPGWLSWRETPLLFGLSGLIVGVAGGAVFWLDRFAHFLA